MVWSCTVGMERRLLQPPRRAPALRLLLILAYIRGCAVSAAAGLELIRQTPLVTDQPYFDPSMKPILTAHVGHNTDLHCRVHSIGNRTVSWIRGRDVRILTVGRYTYTSDLRYEALHLDGTNQWTLRIKSVQPRDQGDYECQVSTKPIKAFSVFLRVLEPRIEILGAPDLYVQRASRINLTCIIYDVPEPPSFVLWHHEGRDISYSSDRGGVSTIVEKGPTTVSHLLIQSARDEDAGIYTCAPADHNLTTIVVHVLHGGYPAPMLTNSSNAGSTSHFLLLMTCVVPLSTLLLTLNYSISYTTVFDAAAVFRS